MNIVAASSYIFLSTRLWPILLATKGKKEYTVKTHFSVGVIGGCEDVEGQSNEAAGSQACSTLGRLSASNQPGKKPVETLGAL
jgi:hypothetical protein